VLTSIYAPARGTTTLPSLPTSIVPECEPACTASMCQSVVDAPENFSSVPTYFFLTSSPVIGSYSWPRPARTTAMRPASASSSGSTSATTQRFAAVGSMQPA
jgi:hypothetical protein